MTPWTTVIWDQFGAAIDALGSAIAACPDDVWDDGSKPPELFWYSAYHVLFFLDFYLSDAPEGFAPPPPFGITELDPVGAMPERTYTKAELERYVAHCRAKCRAKVAALRDEDALRPSASRKNVTAAELHLYNLRHVQHHAGQLNLLLRQKTGAATRWVSKARAT